VLTRCPACETHFRITPAQLKARSGSVRCGACQNVFNALDSLIEEPPAMVVPATARPLPPAIVPPPSSASADKVTVASAPTPEPTPGPIAEPTSAPTPEPLPQTPDEFTTSPPEAAEPPLAEPIGASEGEHVEPAAAPAAATEPETAAEPEAVATRSDGGDWSTTFPEPPPPPRRWPWLIGSLIAVAALGLQAVLAFRVELAVLWPQARPTLVALCEIAACEVGLPARARLVGIEASDLHPDSEHKGRLALTATLKNRAPFAQQFPHLELTLTDTAERAVARKILAPADYLPPGRVIANGMEPNADIAVTVGIDSGTMVASGYLLYLFYP
jgi:predicted Zn finger-like uncharacterized protein